MSYQEKLAKDDGDLCPHGHGPMYYWPAGDEWACQNPSCPEMLPVALNWATRFRSCRDWLWRESVAMNTFSPAFFKVTGV